MKLKLLVIFFRQTLNEQTSEPENYLLVQQINDLERDSIEKIRQTADEVRKLLLHYTAKHIPDIEIELNKFTDQLRQSRHENDLVETDLYRWKNQLIQLSDELNKPSNITIRQDSKSLVNRIYVDISTITSCMMKTNGNTRWLQNGITVAGGTQRVNRLNQLYYPWGICIHDDEHTMYIADTFNHRIIEWKYGATNGQVVAGGNGAGNRMDQLNVPTDVIIDKENDCLIICDQGNSRVHEVRRWRIGDSYGIVVAGGHGQGHRLDQLNSPCYIFVDQDYSVYTSDEKNHRVMKWIKGATEGIIVVGSQGQGNGLAQLSCPRGVIVDQLGTVYVADCDNNRVMCWSKEAKQGTIVVGGNNEGKQSNQLYYPQDLSFDRQYNLYVVDYGNDRMQRFNIDSSSS
ncbi:unnamed protein product [Rotaria sp. Silwood1]|nr:unnamed protein product [Rotaria sp. Silwood1]